MTQMQDLASRGMLAPSFSSRGFKVSRTAITSEARQAARAARSSDAEASTNVGSAPDASLAGKTTAEPRGGPSGEEEIRGGMEWLVDRHHRCSRRRARCSSRGGELHTRRPGSRVGCDGVVGGGGG